MPPRLPSLTSSQVIKVLKHCGFLLDHVTGSHYIFYHPETKRRVTVPYHTHDLPRGTLTSIVKQSGLGYDAFQE